MKGKDKKIPRVTWYREITPKMAVTKTKGNIKLTATLSENTESNKLQLEMRAEHPDGKVSEFPLDGNRGIEDKNNIPLEDYNKIVNSMDDFMDNLQDGLPKFLFEVADKNTNKQEFGIPSGVTIEDKTKSSKLTLNKLSIDTTDKTNEEILAEIKKEVPDIPQKVLDTILDDLEKGNSHSTSVIEKDVIEDLKNAFESVGKSSKRITSILPEDEQKLDELEKLAEEDKNKADKLTREKALIKKYGKAKIAKLAKKMNYKLGK